MNSNICVHETLRKTQCLQCRWKKSQENQMLGGKVRLITKLWEIMKQKLKQTPSVKKSTRNVFVEKKGHYSSDKTEKSTSWEMLISKQAEG